LKDDDDRLKIMKGDGQFVKKMLEEYEKGAQAQDNALAEERRRQFQKINEKIEKRKPKVEEAKRLRQE